MRRPLKLAVQIAGHRTDRQLLHVLGKIRTEKRIPDHVSIHESASGYGRFTHSRKIRLLKGGHRTDGLTSNQQRSTIDYRLLMAVYWLETQSGLLIAGFLRALVSLDRGGALELIGRSNLRWSGHCMQSSCDLFRYIATEP
jgi:hypothetical protein